PATLPAARSSPALASDSPMATALSVRNTPMPLDAVEAQAAAAATMPRARRDTDNPLPLVCVGRVHVWPTRRRPATTAASGSAPNRNAHRQPCSRAMTGTASPARRVEAGMDASFTPKATPWRPGSTLERSEEHTSELQSRENLVCRLLLEKKKRTKNPYH